MPYGRTTVVGLPSTNIHAWFFANDSSPGFGAESYDLSEGSFRAPAAPFVAGWSNGRHDPPRRLAMLAERLKEQGLTPRSLLGIDESLAQGEQYVEMRKQMADMERTIELPEGYRVRVGDLIALISYDFLKRR